MNAPCLLASLADVLPGGALRHPLAGFLGTGLVLLALAAILVFATHKSVDGDLVGGRFTAALSRRFVRSLLAVPGVLWFFTFAVFAGCVRAHFDGWPERFSWGTPLDPWIRFFQCWEAALLLLGATALFVAMSAALVAIVRRRSPAFAFFRAAAILSASCLFPTLLAMTLAPQPFALWWWD